MTKLRYGVRGGRHTIMPLFPVQHHVQHENKIVLGSVRVVRNKAVSLAEQRITNLAP
jgi:hypothetical protein